MKWPTTSDQNVGPTRTDLCGTWKMSNTYLRWAGKGREGKGREENICFSDVINSDQQQLGEVWWFEKVWPNTLLCLDAKVHDWERDEWRVYMVSEPAC